MSVLGPSWQPWCPVAQGSTEPCSCLAAIPAARGPSMGSRGKARNMVLCPSTSPAQPRTAACGGMSCAADDTQQHRFRMGCDFLRQVLGLGLPVSNYESEQEQLPHQKPSLGQENTSPPCAAIAPWQAGYSPPANAKHLAGSQVLLVPWPLCFFPSLAQAMKIWGQQRGVPSWRGDAAGQDPGGSGHRRVPLPWAPGAAPWPPMPQGAAWGQRVEKPTSAELKLHRGDLRAPTRVQPAAR